MDKLRQKKSPRGRPGAGGLAAGRCEVLPHYCTFQRFCQAPTPATLLANAESLLSDPDPQAWGWAAHLLDLAVQGLEKASRAAYLAECCEAAGDLAGWWSYRRVILLHQARAWLAMRSPEPLEAIP